MIWLTWRQFRAQALLAVTVLALFAVVYALTGPNLAHLYDSSGLAGCHAPRDCAALTNTFLAAMKADSVYPLLYFLGSAALILAPALMGAFWGAPLVARELENGTFRLVWNQSVTRARWTVVKLGALAAAAVVVTGLLSLVVTWWAAPIDRAGGFPVGTSQLSRFSPQIFDARGVTPMGYAAFAFVLGALVGVLIRRTLPAMAITLAVFAAVQIGTPMALRPNLLTPVQATTAQLTPAQLNTGVMNSAGQLTLPASMPGAWIVANQTITPAGQVFVLPDVPACQSGTHRQCWSWLATQHLRQRVTYQPASRYWDFQWYETGIYLALTGILAGFCVHRISRDGRT